MKTIKTTLVLIFALLVSVTTMQAQNTTKKGTNDQKYIKIQVNGLACPFCAYGIEKKLKKVKGASNVHVSLQGGYATFQVPSDEAPSKETLRKIIADAGFEAKDIQYADSPFKGSDIEQE